MGYDSMSGAIVVRDARGRMTPIVLDCLPNGSRRKECEAIATMICTVVNKETPDE